MSDKRPLHGVIHLRLKGIIVSLVINHKLSEPDAARIEILLSLLRDGEMPVEAAHAIAAQLPGFPGLIERAGHSDLAQFAQGVLDDLKAREDKKPSFIGRIVSRDLRT